GETALEPGRRRDGGDPHRGIAELPEGPGAGGGRTEGNCPRGGRDDERPGDHGRRGERGEQEQFAHDQRSSTPAIRRTPTCANCRQTVLCSLSGQRGTIACRYSS